MHSQIFSLLRQNLFTFVFEGFQAYRVSRSGRTTSKLNFTIFFWQIQYALIFSVSSTVSFNCIQILVPTYQNIFKTNKHTITKQIYLVVHITWQIYISIINVGRYMLTIQRIKTTLENWDHHVFLQKIGLNCPTK